MRPQPRVRGSKVKSTRVSQVTPESPGIPRTMVYGLLRALPGDRAFLSPSSSGRTSARLNASVEASGPHDFAVRLSAIRQRRIRVHRIPPRVRDDRDTPLLWDETPTDIQLIWVRAKTIFRKFRNIFVAPSPDSFLTRAAQSARRLQFLAAQPSLDVL